MSKSIFIIGTATAIILDLATDMTNVEVVFLGLYWVIASACFKYVFEVNND